MSSDIVHAILAIETLTIAGSGSETILKHIAERNYGNISKIAKKIFRSKESLTDALYHEIQKSPEPEKSVLNILYLNITANTPLIEPLKDLFAHEKEILQLSTEKYFSKLKIISTIFVCVVSLLPMAIIFFYGLLGSVSQQTTAPSIFTIPQITYDLVTTMLLLSVALAYLFILVAKFTVK